LQLNKLGAEPILMSPQKFDQMLKMEMDSAAILVKESKMAVNWLTIVLLRICVLAKICCNANFISFIPINNSICLCLSISRNRSFLQPCLGHTHTNLENRVA